MTVGPRFTPALADYNPAISKGFLFFDWLAQRGKNILIGRKATAIFSPMNIESLRHYCLAKKGVEEGFPFGPDNLVFKVGGKLFLLASLDAVPLRFNIKCEPDNAVLLREQYDSVLPGYHMNKQHWNTIVVDGTVPDKILQQWITDSYDLILESLPKKRKQEILSLS